MKKLILVLALLASPAWGQYYPDTGEAGNAAAVQTAREYEQQNQNWRTQEQISNQQQQIQQIQSQPQPYIQYVPVYGNGTNPTQ